MPTKLLPDIIQLAKQAGKAALSYWRNDVTVETKHDNSPITEADLASNQIIIDGLSGLTPDIPILSEEACLIDYNTRQKWQQWWLIDPLDGTKEFIDGNADFTVNIALIIQGVVKFGVVFIPASNTCYFGGKEIGAWCIDPQGNKRSIQCNQGHNKQLKIIASRRHSSIKQQLLLDNLQQLTSISLKNAGSSLKFCLIAEGDADCYPRFAPTCQWDTAAAQGVLEGAGGCVLNEKGQPLNYSAKEDYLNPNFIVLGDPERWQKPIFDIIKDLPIN